MSAERPIPPDTYVAILGASGSGKSTTAELVAEQTGMTYLAGNEHAQPELRDGILAVNQRRSDLEIERWFVDYHRKLLAEWPDGTLVTDFSLEMDQAYGRGLLSAEDYADFRIYLEDSQRDIRTPDLLVVLEVPPEEMVRRKWRRYDDGHRSDDRVPDPAVLAAVQQAHLDLVESIFRERATVLTVEPGQTREEVAEAASEQIGRRLPELITDWD